MKTIDRKIKFVRNSGKECEVLDKNSKKHLFYATVIGVALYLCILSIIGIH